MPLNVKPIDASATKYADNASRAATEYAVNAAAGAEAWARQTAASADNYGQAIAASGIKNRFRSGVVKAGAAKYARKINDVGKDRYGPGVSAGKDDYKSGSEPYFSTLASLSLSARKPKGDPANYKRVEEVGKALNSKKLALLGG
ncbi:MAG: hypothetical protein A2Y89_06740 [Chloroflexi bacterium RBG_13_51_18]|nr:MAG: hypothetical protein A2Y89_06740 [Chloroflexi bacterium RBG_13_51_18]